MIVLALAIFGCATIAEGTIDFSTWSGDARGLSIFVFIIGTMLLVFFTD